MRGKFITIEGQDGAGKSTNLAVVAELLKRAGKDLVVTREPGGTAFGERVRELILGSNDQQFGDMAELLLIFAARAQHINEVIEPALTAGKWVLCDRFTDATFAYQGGGRGIDLATITQLEQMVQGSLQPDLTLLLDLPIEVGESRAEQRSAPDRFERQQRRFKAKVRDSYLQRARAYPQRFTVVDASAGIDDVKLNVSQAVRHYLALNCEDSAQSG